MPDDELVRNTDGHDDVRLTDGSYTFTTEAGYAKERGRESIEVETRERERGRERGDDVY